MIHVVLPAVQEGAKRAVKAWEARGRPEAMMIPVGTRLPRWLLRLVPGSDEGHLKEVAYLGRIYVQDEVYHFAATKIGQLVFSTVAPTGNLITDFQRLEELDGCFSEDLQVQFVGRLRRLLDEYLQKLGDRTR